MSDLICFYFVLVSWLFLYSKPNVGVLICFVFDSMVVWDVVCCAFVLVSWCSFVFVYVLGVVIVYLF